MFLNLKTPNSLKIQHWKFHLSTSVFNLIWRNPKLTIGHHSLDTFTFESPFWTTFKKKMWLMLKPTKFPLQLITEYPSSEFFFTDGSKHICKPFTCQLPNSSSIFTRELWAILLALRHVYHFNSNKKKILILSDSLLSLQAAYNLKYDQPILVKILKLYMELTWDGKKFVFISAMWALEEIRLQTLLLSVSKWSLFMF